MLTGVFYIIAIVIFAIFTILSFIFSIIYFINSKKGKFAWLGGFLFSLIGLVVSVFLLVNTMVKKAASFARHMEETFSNSGKNFYDQMDTSIYKIYSVPDSVNSKQIEYLVSIEPKKHQGGVPD